MKFLVKTTILLATGLAPFYANAAATPQTQNITFSSASSRAAGAAYFMNNDPTANYLFAADIGADAKVTLRSAYYTGGRGAQGTGNNVLFSQGPVSATHQRTGNFEVVAVVNVCTLNDWMILLNLGGCSPDPTQ
ncbi:hypothetical protein AX15_004102 [Amanita polypyramis BW_CC]|nr:hypothetical protein AX15_004102 [Amanita polypyramis BW_CC]